MIDCRNSIMPDSSVFVVEEECADAECKEAEDEGKDEAEDDCDEESEEE